MKNIDFDNLTDDQLDRLVNDFKTINMNIPNTYAKAVVSDMKAEIKKINNKQWTDLELEILFILQENGVNPMLQPNCCDEIIKVFKNRFKIK